ncbi:MAG: putative sugar O-methyltransferase [Solirubrobacteraceae bacterium]
MNLERDLPPWLKRILIRVGTPVGVTRHNWTLLETMSRPWWLYRSAGRIPAIKIKQMPPNPVTDVDIEICERLIVAFAAAAGEGGSNGKPDGGLWAWIWENHHRRLGEALKRGYAPDLACLLASMFREDFASGIEHGGPICDLESWLGSRIQSRKGLDALVSLGEALGVVPVENPEQGRAGIAFDDGITSLIASIDQALGIHMDAPNVGAPFGLAIDERLMTLEMPELIYAGMRLNQAIQAQLPLTHCESVSVVEIGGGYGGMGYWFLQMCPQIASYTIVDLPTIGVLQGYYLAKVLGPTRVSFFGEPSAQVRLVPNHSLTHVETPFDVLVNKDSMPEMPHSAMVQYLEWARSNCAGFFYSYNQETTADFRGEAQGIVANEMSKVGGFDRVRRDHSWLRRGYSEEVYVRSDGAGGLGRESSLLASASHAQHQPQRVGDEQQT